MNSFIFQLKTELASAQIEYKELKIKAVRCIYELQQANPYFGDDIDLIPAEQLEQSADELLQVKNKLKEVQQKINEIKAQLGEK